MYNVNSQLMECIHKIAFDTAKNLYLNFTPETAQSIHNLIEANDNINAYCSHIEQEILSIVAEYTKTYILNDIWINKEMES